MQPHNRILALTFMHGSRRRLEERLAQPAETRGRVTCMTIDSFANHVVRRWQSCLGELPDMKQFDQVRSEEHTSELQSLMRISYAVFCLKKKKYRHSQ